MLPIQAIFERFGILLAADTSTLAPAANPPKVMLVKDPFTPADDLLVADLTEADFDGYAKISCEVAGQLQSTDPLTGDSVVEMKTPLGGWRWETTGVTNLPETIYGFALINNGSTLLYGTELFDTPIVLTASNQTVIIPSVSFSMKLGSVV
jgi:hypothetical protein